MNDKPNIAVVGFGYIGSIVGAVLADRGYRVYGIDPHRRIADAVNAGTSPFPEPGLDRMIARNVSHGRLSVDEDFGVVEECEVVIIAVGTPLANDRKPDVSQIVAACKMIVPRVRENALVMLKSTVLPHTTELVVKPMFTGTGVHLAYCPERLAEGSAIDELTAIPVVVGGVDPASTQRAASFWRSALGVEVVEVADATSAELVKLADNLWIDLNIAMAGELAMLCDKLQVDVLDVIHAANTLPKGSGTVHILTPSVGVGGYCLTKDPWFVHRIGKDLGLNLSIPQVSRTVNDAMPDYAAGLMESFLDARGRPAEELKVAVLGVAFKNNTGDCRFTPTKPVIDRLAAKGYRVSICDCRVTEEDRIGVTSLPFVPNPHDAMRDADCVAFLAAHDELRAIDVGRIAELARPGAMVFDGRRFFSKTEIEAMRAKGLVYKGVGR